MLRVIAALWAMLVLAAAAGPVAAQATLSYSYGAPNTTYHFRPLFVTASQGGADIWKMKIWVPEAGYTMPTAEVAAPGEIAEFYDLAYGGIGFNYSPEGMSHSWSPGLLRMGGAYGDFSDAGGQTAGYYEWTRTYTRSNITYVIRGRINAPVLSGADYQTLIDGSCHITNNSGASFNVSNGSDVYGDGHLAVNAGGLTDWSIVNPTTSTGKPNIHNTDFTNGHQLYMLYDWYGSTVIGTIKGFFAKAVVKYNSYTQTRNMRPGLTFELRCDAADFAYSAASKIIYGATTVSAGNGVWFHLDRHAMFGSGAQLPDGQSLDLAWNGVISTTPTQMGPVAEAGPDQSLRDVDLDTFESVTLSSAGSYDPDGAIVQYSWSVGGTEIATGPSPQVTLAIGTSLVTLTVTDDAGATGADTMTVTITSPLKYVDQNNPAASDANPGSEALPWKTVRKAGLTLISGETVFVKEGLYREVVDVAHSGVAGAPITLQAYPGHRAIISGAVEISGWQPLPQNLARGNADFAHLYYVDLDWEPGVLYEDAIKLLEQSRAPHISPTAGFWLIGAGSDATHIVDTAHLTQSDPAYWVGATLQLRNNSNFTRDDVKVTAYEPAARRLTLSAAVGMQGDTGPQIGNDYYYLYNKLELINQPGDWATEDLGGGQFRVYLWPSDGGAPAGHLYEVPVNNDHLMSLSNRQFITVEGFELRHMVGGQALTCSNGSDIMVRKCLFFGNAYMTVYFYNADRGTVKNCLFTGGGFGVMIGGGCSDMLVEGNEIFKNRVDGVVVGHGNTGVRILRNYIHHQSNEDHPDGIQLYGEPGGAYDVDIWIEDNALVCCGQSLMTAQTDGLHVNNNVFVGSSSGMLKYNWNTIFNLSQDHNSCAMAGLMMFENVEGNNFFNVTNNIFYEGQDYPTFLARADAAQVFSSDYNMFFDGPGINGRLMMYQGVRYTYPNYKAVAVNPPLDVNSSYGDPLFVNAPSYITNGHPYLNYYFTTSRVYTWSFAPTFTVGDHLEVDVDGVMRTITATGQDAVGYYIDFAPSLDRPPPSQPILFNWKTRTSTVLDLALQPTSWAKGRAADGSDLGANLNLANYRAGDFDGDGQRDIPAFPPVSAQAAAGLDFSWVYQNTPVTTGDRHLCLLTVNVSGASSYAVSVTKSSGPGEVVIVPTGSPLLWTIKGGRRQTGGTAGTGTVMLEVAVTPSGGSPVTTSVTLAVRSLGDIDSFGGVSGQDKLLLNKRLNGLVPDGREYDLDGLGGANGQDKLILNKILNGLVIP